MSTISLEDNEMKPCIIVWFEELINHFKNLLLFILFIGATSPSDEFFLTRLHITAFFYWNSSMLLHLLLHLMLFLGGFPGASF